MGALSVRTAEPTDLDAVLALYVQLAEDRAESLPAARPQSDQILRSILAQPDRALIVATLDDIVVGTADMLVVANLTHHGMSWAIVENVVVDQTIRRGGVGRALMEDIVRRCRDAGCYKVQLLSRRHRLGAHAFYERLGFQSSAEGFRLYLD